nr:methanobactin export MATE transporter MbnM [Methylocystis iwaonis]
MIDTGFWRGYSMLAASACAASVTMQIDLAMIARSGGRVAGAFAVLMRMTLLDVALTIALASVAGIAAAHATDRDHLGSVIGQICVLVTAVGVVTSALGFFAYPPLLAQLIGTEEAAPLIGQPIFWLVAGTPLRMLANAQGFVLHALGQGSVVFRSKLAEAPSKFILNFLLMDALGFDLAGCMIAGFVIAAASSLSLWLRLRELGAWSFDWPERAFARWFLWTTFWESHRILSPQAAMLLALTLFSSTRFSGYGVDRLDAFAAGQAFMLFVLSPMPVLTRFLALHLTAVAPQKQSPALIKLAQSGAPIVSIIAISLFIGRDWIGESLYHQHGSWWSTFIAVLSLSLPIRYFGSVSRGAMLARGRFPQLAMIDAFAQWLLTPLFLFLGLSADAPWLAYLSLIIPEVACVCLIPVALCRSRHSASLSPLPSEGPIR